MSFIFDNFLMLITFFRYLQYRGQRRKDELVATIFFFFYELLQKKKGGPIRGFPCLKLTHTCTHEYRSKLQVSELLFCSPLHFAAILNFYCLPFYIYFFASTYTHKKLYPFVSHISFSRCISCNRQFCGTKICGTLSRHFLMLSICKNGKYNIYVHTHAHTFAG